MRKIFLSLSVVALAAATVAGGPAIAKHGPPHGKSGQARHQNNAKTWICHLANSRKYVAIRVSAKALKAHSVEHHGDIIGTNATGQAVPQTRAAARTFCAAQPVMTPTRGGVGRDATLTNQANPGVSATLQVRVRRGQDQLCFRIRVAGATDVSSLTISRGTTTVNLDAHVAGTDTTERGCVNVSRELAAQILQSPGDFTATAVVTVGTTSVTLTGPLSR